MTDQEKLEKVIKGLESCASLHQCFWCESCEYSVSDCAIEDAMELLKAQEEKVVNLTTKIAELTTLQEPMLVVDIHKEHNNVLNPNVPWVGKCPKCGKKVSGKNLTRFCMYCGQAVKWE